MRKSVLILLAVIASVLPMGAENYFCDFEDVETAAGEWISWRGTSILNETWKVGHAIHYTGRGAMYVSDLTIDSVGGNTHAWPKEGLGYTISTYHKLSLGSGTYTVSLDMLCPTAQLSVALVQADTLTQMQLRTTSGADYANIIKTNNVTGLTDLKASSWTHVSASVAVATPTTGVEADYLLVITFRSQGEDMPVGAAVDNVEIVKNQTDQTACNYPIKDLTLELVSGFAQLTWKGNADAYEVRYFDSDSLLVTLDTVFANPSSSVDTCLIPLDNIVDGVYSFMVRTASCEDNSPWAYVRNKLIYDPSAHCIDYLNFDASGVNCKYGKLSSASSSYQEVIDNSLTVNGYYDMGYKSEKSLHTIHFVPGETDPRTLNQLHTVPEGAFASVRMGTFEKGQGGGWQQISYTIPIDSSMGVLQFQYALVIEDGMHTQLEQTHFRLKLYDENNQLINGECGDYLFVCPNSVADMNAQNRNPKTAGWHRVLSSQIPGMSNGDLYWRDWTRVAINVREYIGQTVRVEITNYGCVYDYHFGYVYFVLNCSPGKLGGVTCGEKPREMVADEGFFYRWYKPYNPSEPFYEGQNPEAQSLYVSPNDSNTYYVDLISKANEECYFTLHASAMARLPKALLNMRHVPKDCINYVELNNESGLFGFFTNATTGASDSVRIDGELAQQKWSIRTESGLTNIEGADALSLDSVIASNDGDIVYVDLHVAMDEGCEDDAHFEFVVPAIGPSSSVDSLILCQGQSIEFEGQTYTEAGDYPLMTEKTWAGCDSTRTLHIDYEFSYIFQRWGDLLSVKKNAHPDTDDSTHYEFVGFQWLLNGEPIEGATQSYYYAGDGNVLLPTDVYRVLLTYPDGTTEESCDYYPVEYIAPAPTAQKILRNGRIYILREGGVYDLNGRKEDDYED